MKMTYHAQFERTDRIAEILATIGLGEIILTIDRDRHGDPTVERCLTSTGVILIRNAYSKIVITAFMGNPKKIRDMYCEKGYTRIPPQMNKIVNNNIKKYSYLFDMQA